jgi:hypothetical protein
MQITTLEKIIMVSDHNPISVHLPLNEPPSNN